MCGDGARRGLPPGGPRGLGGDSQPGDPSGPRGERDRGRRGDRGGPGHPADRARGVPPLSGSSNDRPAPKGARRTRDGSRTHWRTAAAPLRPPRRLSPKTKPSSFWTRMARCSLVGESPWRRSRESTCAARATCSSSMPSGSRVRPWTTSAFACTTPVCRSGCGTVGRAASTWCPSVAPTRIGARPRTSCRSTCGSCGPPSWGQFPWSSSRRSLHDAWSALFGSCAPPWRTWGRGTWSAE